MGIAPQWQKTIDYCDDIENSDYLLESDYKANDPEPQSGSEPWILISDKWTFLYKLS